MRRVKQAIIGAWILVAIMCVAMVGGAYLNDRLIAEAPVRPGPGDLGGNAAHLG